MQPGRFSQLRGVGSYEELAVQNKSRPANFIRKTKLACRVGPQCWDVPALVDLVQAGMDMACLDLSTPVEHEELRGPLESLREILSDKEFEGRNLAVMCETKGPVIVTGELGTPSKRLRLMRGQTLEIVSDSSVMGGVEKVGCNYPGLSKSVKPGSKIFISTASKAESGMPATEFSESGLGGGVIELTVLDTLTSSITARVENGGVIGEGARIRLPGCAVDLPTLTTKDCYDIDNFVLTQNVDMLAVSFVRDANDIKQARKHMGDDGRFIKVLAKIENQEAVDNITEIINEADGIILCRNALGLELPFHLLPFVQRMITQQAGVLGKPLWISAVTSPEHAIPTRSDICDTCNFVLDGCDGMFLTTELSDEYYRRLVLQSIVKVLETAEAMIDETKSFLRLRGRIVDSGEELSAMEALASSAVMAGSTNGLSAGAIVVISDEYENARLVAKYRPQCPVIAVTSNDTAARQIAGSLRGVRPVLVESLEGSDAIVYEGISFGRRQKWLQDGDHVVSLRSHNGMQEVAIMTV